MIYFIVTTSLINDDFEIRKQEYVSGISKLINLTKNIKGSSIIIVENNGKRDTFLDFFDSRDNVKIHYTNNNSLHTKSKGIKEFNDIMDVIQFFNIQDSDFVVKITGRYILNDDSQFLNIIQNYNNNIHCIIKYGSYFKPVNYKMEDCITGLIGMMVFYIKQIDRTNETPIEWEWAKVSLLIQDIHLCIIHDKMGLNLKTVGDKVFTLV